MGGFALALALSLALASTAAVDSSATAASGGTASPSSQLSRQTQEWWRWVLVRIYDSSTFIADGDDAARQTFVDEWRPDIFDWGTQFCLRINAPC
jgi:hypothetical protein